MDLKNKKNADWSGMSLKSAKNKLFTFEDLYTVAIRNPNITLFGIRFWGVWILDHPLCMLTLFSGWLFPGVRCLGSLDLCSIARETTRHSWTCVLSWCTTLLNIACIMLQHYSSYEVQLISYINGIIGLTDKGMGVRQSFL